MKTLSDFDLTTNEVKEYEKLKTKIFGKGILKSIFVELDMNNKDHARYNELSKKILPLLAYIANNSRNF